MGRPRKSNSLKVLDGDRLDRINPDEPDSPPGLGEPPDWFDDYALQAWAQMARLLGPMKIAKAADVEAAMIYCQAYTDFRQAKDSVESEGMLIENVTEIQTEKTTIIKTSQKAHPLLPTIRQAQRQMMQILGQFGMTPSARAALRVESDPAENKLLKLMESRRGNRANGGNPKPKDG